MFRKTTDACTKDTTLTPTPPPPPPESSPKDNVTSNMTRVASTQGLFANTSTGKEHKHQKSSSKPSIHFEKLHLPGALCPCTIS